MEIWSLVWECSQALEFILRHINLSHTTCLELGAGVGHVSLALQQRGVSVVATDGESQAVEKMCVNGVRNARVLSWDDPSFSDRFDLVFGSDLLYEADSVEKLFGLVQQIEGVSGSPTLLIMSAPLRKPFFDFVRKLEETFRFVLCKRIEPPECEPAMAVVACRSESVLYGQIASQLLQHEKEAKVVFSDSIPPPPPLPD